MQLILPVVTIDGDLLGCVPGVGRCALRFFLHCTLDALPYPPKFVMIGLLLPIVHRNRITVADKYAKTLVIRNPTLMNLVHRPEASTTNVAR
jgi:hypothetical protein